VGIAYKVVENKDIVNDFKIRGNFGKTGNQEFSPNSAISRGFLWIKRYVKRR
jgi:iron complex outermembrane receptor protein